MLKENDKAINFKLLNQKNEEVTLDTFLNKTFILYFYSKDNTSGCTCQAIAYKELYNEFKKLNVEIVGVSKDSVTTHKNFINKYDLPFILLSDNEKEVANLYDVLKEKNMYGKKVIGTLRSSFIIRNGIIVKANYKVDPKLDAKLNLEYLLKI